MSTPKGIHHRKRSASLTATKPEEEIQEASTHLSEEDSTAEVFTKEEDFTTEDAGDTEEGEE